jgi:NAD(P)-dependent dehydrogenase (short-subunit alcohol dehydrogenase family)
MPMRRLAQVEDVVGAISFLLGERASFITGQTLYVDGGYTWAG